MKINSTLCVHFRQWIIHNDCRTIRNNHQMDKELITENCWRNFKLRLGLDGKRKMCCVLDIHKLSLFSIDWFYCCALINIAEIKDILKKQLDEEMRINYEQWNISTKKLPRVKINFNVEGNLCGGGGRGWESFVFAVSVVTVWKAWQDRPQASSYFLRPSIPGLSNFNFKGVLHILWANLAMRQTENILLFEQIIFVFLPQMKRSGGGGKRNEQQDVCIKPVM